MTAHTPRDDVRSRARADAARTCERFPRHCHRDAARQPVRLCMRRDSQTRNGAPRIRAFLVAPARCDRGPHRHHFCCRRQRRQRPHTRGNHSHVPLRCPHSVPSDSVASRQRRRNCRRLLRSRFESARPNVAERFCAPRRPPQRAPRCYWSASSHRVSERTGADAGRTRVRARASATGTCRCRATQR